MDDDSRNCMNDMVPMGAGHQVVVDIRSGNRGGTRCARNTGNNTNKAHKDRRGEGARIHYPLLLIRETLSIRNASVQQA